MPFLFFLFIGAAVVIVAVNAAKSRVAALNEAWGLVAKNLELMLEPAALSKSPKLEGSVQGYPLTVEIEKRGSGNSRSHWTAFSMDVRSLPRGFQLKKEGFLSGISKVFGGQDIEVGDEVFDRQVLVKGRDEAATRGFLTPARRVRIRRFFEGYPDGVITDTGVTWAGRGRINDAGRMLDTIREMLRVARSLAGDEEQDRPLEQAMQAQRAGILDQAMSILQQGRPPGTADAVRLDTPLDEQLLEGNLLYLSNRTQEAEQVFRRALEAAPEDREVKGWARLAATTALTGAAAALAHSAAAAGSESEPAADPVAGAGVADPVAGASVDDPVTGAGVAAPVAGAPVGWVDSPGEPAATPAPASAAGGSPLSIAEFCDAVFAPGTLSFEAARTFEERYRGNRVVWTGTLTSVEPYRFDFVFGSGPAVKATLTIHEAEASVFGDGEVKAVIQLPADTDGLDARIGERLSFSAELLKVDGFMKNVFMRDARVE